MSASELIGVAKLAKAYTYRLTCFARLLVGLRLLKTIYDVVVLFRLAR